VLLTRAHVILFLEHKSTFVSSSSYGHNKFIVLCYVTLDTYKRLIHQKSSHLYQTLGIMCYVGDYF